MRAAFLGLFLIAACAPAAAPSPSPTATATPIPTASPTPAPTATPDPARAEFLRFFRAYYCPDLRTLERASTAAWDKYVASGTRADGEAVYKAQAELIASLGRLPRPPAARQLHEQIIAGEEVFLEAIVALQRYISTGDAAQNDRHRSLISEYNAEVRETSDAIADVARTQRLVAADLVNSADCSFLR